MKRDSISALSFYFVNDNYIATWLPGEEGHYFGADDFLTASLLLHYYRNNWQYSMLLNTLTLRHFNLRYDLLSFIFSRKFYKDNFQITATAGFILKGEFGGNFLQNGYHKFRAIRRVNIPYSNNKGPGIIFGFDARWKKTQLLFENDNMQLSIASKIYSNFMASHLDPGISYHLYFWGRTVQTETMISYRKYLNTVNEYSAMVTPGMLYGINTKINIYNNYYFDVGFITLPTKNVESDSKYPPYKNNYLPQVWIGFSWQTAGTSISDFLFY